MALSAPTLTTSGARKSSMQDSNLTTSLRPRLVTIASFTGNILGAWPSVPNIPVARSCVRAPTASSATASLNELLVFGTTTTTCDSAIGRSVDPKLKYGWPKA